jgi:membrane fusion protein, multidrug efflux system
MTDTNTSKPEKPHLPTGTKHGARRIPLIIGSAAVLVVCMGVLLVAHATANVNRVALASLPVGVTAVEARQSQYAPTHHYVGTLLPWVEAKIGPQLISAYVGSVLVRPGDRVRRGQVIGTLDCRNASATSQAVSMQARALQEQQGALAHEAARLAELQHGGFASDNEIEKKQAESASKQAELLSSKASLQRATLEVNDCVLRAPFDGEVSERTMDPGAYAHPGQSIATLIDRTTIRVGADVPEEDFALVKPGDEVGIHALANGRRLQGKIARRSPAADPSTRTVHFEVDLPDPERVLPVGTTAELTVAAGAPIPAIELPLAGAAVKGTRATIFLAENDRPRKVVLNVLGERAGRLFVEPTLSDRALVIVEGRALLKEGDRLQVKVDREPLQANSQPSSLGGKGSAL